jgi:hypothetical protein
VELWDAKRCAVPRKPDPNRARICGVYFLYRDNEVIYVGQSVDVLGRVVHSSRGPWWGVTGFSYVECPSERLSHVERACILALLPERNLVRRRPGFVRVPSLTSRTGSVEVRLDTV